MRISLPWMYGLLLFASISPAAVQAETAGSAEMSAADERVHGASPMEIDGGSFAAVRHTSDGSIQLAAAIGIVKPDAPPVESPAPSVESPPAAESTAPVSNAGSQVEEASAGDGAKSGPSTKTILIGAGVAALLGIAAGGGSGGGSSTPQH